MVTRGTTWPAQDRRWPELLSAAVFSGWRAPGFEESGPADWS
jgi:hypothetical protein